jgi:hypothetical protein
MGLYAICDRPLHLNMKRLTITFLLTLTIISKGQTQTHKLPRDSVRYYQAELNKLWRNTYDSVINSERFKDIQSRLERSNRYKKVTVELLVNAGLYFTDFANLNSRLISIGLEEIKPMVPSVGGSLAVSRPLITYGLEFSAYVFENSSASFKGVHGRYYLGTNIFKKGRFALHPQVGYAGSYLNMAINTGSGQTNFNDLFQSRPNTIQLSHSNSYLDFCLGIKLKSFTKDPSYWQFFRAGYRYGLKEAAWFSPRGGELLNAPVDRNNQYYFQFCIGFDK